MQAPIVRPPPAVRPGDEPQAQPRQRFPVGRQPQGLEMPPAAAPQARSDPAPQSENPTTSWVQLMQKHEIPQGAWTEFVDRYYKLKGNPTDPLGDLPPSLAQDLRSFAQRFPNLGTRAPEMRAPKSAVQPPQTNQPAAPGPQSQPTQPQPQPTQIQQQEPGGDPGRFAAPQINQPRPAPQAQPMPPQQSMPVAQGTPPPMPPGFLPIDEKPLSWSQVPLKALFNAPGSAVKFAHDIVQPILHPIDTVTSLADLGAGLASKVYGAAGGVQNPKSKAEAEKTANAVGQFLVERYGSLEGLKKTLATDPVSVMADVSMILSGGSTIAARGPGIVARAAQPMAAVASALDPIANVGRAGRAIGTAATEGASLVTGAGSRTFRESYKAGNEGNPVLGNNMRPDKPPFSPLNAVVDMADSGIKKFGQEASAAYKANSGGMDALIDLAPVRAALGTANDMVHFKGIAKSEESAKVVKAMEEKYNEFLAIPAAERTAESLDALKQALGEIQQATRTGTPLAQKVAGDVYNAAKAEIVSQVPAYAKRMSDYSQAADFMQEARRTLSVNNRAANDTTLRKLQSTMNNNVNTNWGGRAKLLDEIAKHEPDLPAALAGQALSTWAPRGLARLATTNALLGGAAFSNPMLLPLLALQSPRLMGEAFHGAGYVAGQGRNALAKLGVSPNDIAAAARASYATNALTRRPIEVTVGRRNDDR